MAALRVDFGTVKLWFSNVYVPHKDSQANLDEFKFQLSVVNNVIEQHQDCDIILEGDFNVDFSRNWSHTDLLSDFCNRTNLYPSIKHVCSSVDYTYHIGLTRFNMLDQFIVSEELLMNALSELYASHDMDNTFDHEPLTIQFDIQANRFSASVRKFVHKVVWHKASHADIENNRHTVNNALGNIVIPFAALLCRDVKLCISSHQMALNTYASEISQALVAAGEVAIPHTSDVGCNKNKSIPGWSEFVELLKAKSQFWHNVDYDTSKTGALADVMRRTRASYHYTVRRVRRNEQNFINERFADAMFVDNTRDFWSEVKRLRSHKTCPSNMVDDFKSPCDTANFFASKYQDLYTSVKFDMAEMDVVRGDIESSVLDHGFTNECIITFKEVSRAILMIS